MAGLKPWYKIEGLIPREDLREGKPLDASEFAVHLDQVRDKRAPADYQEPDRFFDRTYLTKYLTYLAAQVVRRLSGETTETSAIFNLSTQFGGGKTHALTLLYHLAKHGPAANKWTGVDKILNQAGISAIPEAAVAVFVGTEFDSITGRGGDDGTPLRKTPWGEIAYQLGGEAAFNIVAEHENQFIEPKGDVIRKFLPKDQPCLILLDEIINYASTYRKTGYGDRLYNFIQALSETARGEKNVVLVVSIPASEMEYTAADEADEQRFKKVLDRLGKAIMMSAESETSEIIRRRLFEWTANAVTPEGKIMLPKDAVTTCNEYADWVIEHKQQLPSFPIESAREAFVASYPFHPTVLSVFERKWQALPRFQRTRGVLRLLALWVSIAYQEGYKGNHRDALIGLGTAPLDDLSFRAAVFDQLGNDRLEGPVTTDICGKKDSHAIRLDAEATEDIKKSRLHRKVNTTIFFESNGGCTRTEATVPEIRLAVGEPNVDIGNVETVLESLTSDCYYLTVGQTKYRFSLYPNLNKILADRRANVQVHRIDQRILHEIQKLFALNQGIQVICFPEQPNNLPNQAVLTLAVMSPTHSKQDESTLKLIESMIRESGASARTFKSALIFAIADSDIQLREEARKMLSWEDIRDEENNLDDVQKKQLFENLKRAQRDLIETVWRAYKYVALLGKDNQIRLVDLGLVTSSSAKSIVDLIINRLSLDGDVENAVSPRFLVRNWSGAFQEWSTKGVRDVFFASPLFPRLLKGDAVLDAIARGVKDGTLALVGKASGDRYEPFEFKTDLAASQIEISDDLFIIKSEVAAAYLQRITDPPKLNSLIISPTKVQLEPGKQQTFIARGRDQYDKEIAIGEIQWTTTGGNIEPNGLLTGGENEGNFTVTATVETISAIAEFAVKSSNGVTAIKTATISPLPDHPTIPLPPKGLKWISEINTQKWMQFYTKILSKFASDKNVKLTVKIEVSIEGEVSQQRRDETKIALQELGLNDDVDVLD
ncbi:ATP-binding protein [Microcoleus sp.]|uniref:ATP-binding protein n=1 Tax=Microcoleus sp. TaxID=44472 RepID=UPI00359430D2